MDVPTSSSSPGPAALVAGAAAIPRRPRGLLLQNRPDLYYIQMRDELHGALLTRYRSGEYHSHGACVFVAAGEFRR